MDDKRERSFRELKRDGVALNVLNRAIKGSVRHFPPESIRIAAQKNRSGLKPKLAVRPHQALYKPSTDKPGPTSDKDGPPAERLPNVVCLFKYAV